jgi:hypothetical protein
MLNREFLKKGVRYTIMGLPMAAIIGSSFLPLQPITHQLLILASLIWLQVTFLLQVFAAS